MEHEDGEFSESRISQGTVSFKLILIALALALLLAGILQNVFDVLQGDEDRRLIRFHSNDQHRPPFKTLGDTVFAAALQKEILAEGLMYDFRIRMQYMSDSKGHDTTN